MILIFLPLPLHILFDPSVSSEGALCIGSGALLWLLGCCPVGAWLEVGVSPVPPLGPYGGALVAVEDLPLSMQTAPQVAFLHLVHLCPACLCFLVLPILIFIISLCVCVCAGRVEGGEGGDVVNMGGVGGWRGMCLFLTCKALCVAIFLYEKCYINKV